VESEVASDLSLKSGRLARYAAAAALVAALAASTLARGPASAVPARPDDRTIVHVLNRAGFGPRPGDVAHVRQVGLEAWIDQQLQPEHIPDTAVEARLRSYETLDLSSREIAQEYFLPAREARKAKKAKGAKRGEAATVVGPNFSSAGSAGPSADAMSPEMKRARQVLVELSAQKIVRAVYSDRQLEEVLTDFWFNHFNVYAGKGLTRVFITEYQREAIRPHVLGRFRDLLGATAKSPAMLFYLDNARSADPRFAKDVESRLGRRGRGSQAEQLRKNIPTGINENYARELMELHTLGVDGGYTQQDVVNVARAFTGWTIAGPRKADAGRFLFNPRMHDPGEKLVLGHRIKAGGGIEDGEQVLDILASHPSTATFISTALARRFVADTPPASVVDRAAAVFRQTGGDLRAVTRAILTSPEFFAPGSYRAKVKTPFDFVVSALRATGADIRQPVPLERTMRELGMPLYFCQPPTGYKDTAEAWVNTGALINRMNFAVALAANTFRGVVVSDPLPDRNQADAETAVDVFLNGDASDATRATIQRAATSAQVVALALGAPEFQRR
jgi:uncharacterized protein (DUF1800 family)